MRGQGRLDAQDPFQTRGGQPVGGVFRPAAVGGEGGGEGGGGGGGGGGGEDEGGARGRGCVGGGGGGRAECEAGRAPGREGVGFARGGVVVAFCGAAVGFGFVFVVGDEDGRTRGCVGGGGGGGAPAFEGSRRRGWCLLLAARAVGGGFVDWDSRVLFPLRLLFSHPITHPLIPLRIFNLLPALQLKPRGTPFSSHQRRCPRLGIDILAVTAPQGELGRRRELRRGRSRCDVLAERGGGFGSAARGCEAVRGGGLARGELRGERAGGEDVRMGRVALWEIKLGG